MGKYSVKLMAIFVFLFSGRVGAQPGHKTSFKVVPLGVMGGLDESNLSAYMIAPAGSNNFVCADAGTLRFGIEKAIANKVFTTEAGTILKSYIKGYLISHGHLDHVAGLILNSPDDTAKNIYAMPYVIKTLRDKYFTWQSWANFANEGDKPTLNKYSYVTLEQEKEIRVAHTEMTIKAYSLAHSNPYESTAFLLNNNGNCLLYLGDTGSDVVEQSDKLSKLWNAMAPLVKSAKLKGIFIEVSYPDEQPDKQLFGHLTPKWLMHEMTALGKLAGDDALKNVPIIITHIKPSANSEATIRKQLNLRNKIGLKLIYPKQGRLLEL